MYNSPYWLDLRAMWSTWPNREITGLFKWYYLVQFAFWIQQILVVNIEEKRKDYAQMFTHHVVTCALLLMSYGYYHTPVGNVILCLMDVIDIILPVS
jgi:acyl-CoA-dependent ceramide synthase